MYPVSQAFLQAVRENTRTFIDNALGLIDGSATKRAVYISLAIVIGIIAYQWLVEPIKAYLVYTVQFYSQCYTCSIMEEDVTDRKRILQNVRLVYKTGKSGCNRPSSAPLMR